MSAQKQSLPLQCLGCVRLEICDYLKRGAFCSEIKKFCRFYRGEQTCKDCSACVFNSSAYEAWEKPRHKRWLSAKRGLRR